MRARRWLGWALALSLAAPAAFAQGPDANWRTVETEHFRVHFPLELEDWARLQAARLESIRSAVSETVGYTPPQVIDVVVSDPLAQANGSAWPLLGRPRILLWTTPPAASSGLGQVSDWGELVAVHEMAHLAHLLRPSRDPLRSLAERFVLPVGPLALGTPRWASEGYATLVEGRLTGSGRPHSALRAAVLRQWARQGRLPSYGRLSKDRDRFLGMSMAYLAGSAYLEWLERRADDPGILPGLWAAASARPRRSFDQAFERVFADRPAALWDRFVAESAASALERERRLATSAREGAIWLDREGGTSSLQVSPDGELLTALLAEPKRPERLVVWDLGAAVPPKTSESNPGADAEDPPAAPRPPRTRAPVAELEASPRRRLLGARFLPDSETLLVGVLIPDLRGDLHAELARWRPGHRLRRLTRQGDVRDADPLSDGRSAIAVRWRRGRSSLVRVALDTGEITDLTPPALDRVHDRPRVAPDGASLAWLEHGDGRWHARLAPLGADGALGPVRELAPLSGGEPIDLAWRRDSSILYAAVANGEELDIEALGVGGEALSFQVTRSVGAALAPAPTPDGSILFYLGLDADGLDIRRLGLDAATTQSREPAVTSAPDAGAPRVGAARFVAAPLAPSRPYGAGRPEATALLAGFAGSGPGVIEAGMRLGDLLGRWELLALGGADGRGATRGGAVRLVARPLPVTLSLDLARFRDEIGELDALELAAARAFQLPSFRLGLAGGLARTRGADSEGARAAAFVGLDLTGELARGRARLRPRLALESSRAWAGTRARHHRAEVDLAATQGKWAARLELERREALRIEDPRDQLSLGGAPSSIAPASARPGRIPHLALPELAALGSRYEGARVRLTGVSAFGALIERHRLDHGPWLRLVGADVRWKLPPSPLVGLPALRLEAGVARVDGGGLRRRTRWWASLTLPLAARDVLLPVDAHDLAGAGPRR